MINLTPKVRRAVYDKIVSLGNFYGKYADGTYSNDDLNVVNFLKQIWDLPAMRSEDPRFRNAEADATQHLINNDDWDTSMCSKDVSICLLVIRYILSSSLS